MKKHLHHISVIVVGALFTVSCGTYNTAYVDDIYYNPKKEEGKKVKDADKIAALKAEAMVETAPTDSSEFFFSDYNENEYADRLNKFHNDDYQGEYYDNNPSWNTNVGIGFSPYGSSFSVGYAYGYNPWYYSYYPYWDPFYYGYNSPWGYPYYSHNYWHHNHHYNYWGDYAYYSPYYSNSIYSGNTDNGRGSHYGQRHSGGSGSPINTTAQGNGNTRKNANGDAGSVNSGHEINEDLAPMGVMRTTRKQPNQTTTQTTTSGAVQRIGTPASAKSVSNKGNDISNVSAARKAKLVEDNYKKPEAVSRSSITKNKVEVPSYTRTKTEAKKSVPASISRNGYTPSYTRTRTSRSNDSYNTGTTYKRPTSVTSPTRNSSTGSTSRTYSRPSSSSTYQATSPSSSSKPRSSYSSPSRSSSSSYSKPSSGSSNRSSGSSYSTPSRSSSSSPSRSSSSGSSSGSSTNSPTRKGR